VDQVYLLHRIRGGADDTCRAGCLKSNGDDLRLSGPEEKEVYLFVFLAYVMGVREPGEGESGKLLTAC